MQPNQNSTPSDGIDLTSARSVDDRQDEIARVFEARFLQRLRRDMVGDVADAYLRTPLGPHDDRTARVVRAFGRIPLADKEVVVPLGPQGPYAIGHIAVGEAGGLTGFSGRFDSYEDAFRAIFKARWDRLK